MKWLPPYSDTLRIVLTPVHCQDLTSMYIYTFWFTSYIVRGKWAVVLQLISLHFVPFKWIYLSVLWPNTQHIYYRWPPRWNLKLKPHWFWNNFIYSGDPVLQLVKLAELHRSHPRYLAPPENRPPELLEENSIKGWLASNLERTVRATSKYRPKPSSKVCCSDRHQAVTQICQFIHTGPKISYSEGHKLREWALMKQIQTLGKYMLGFKHKSSASMTQGLWVISLTTQESNPVMNWVSKAIQFLTRSLPSCKKPFYKHTP